MILTIALGLLLADQAELLVKGPPPQTLKGEIVRQNLKGIVLRIGDKPVQVPWVEVETVNGRPVREHVAQVRTSLKDSLCPDCRGGLIALLCPDCLGTEKVHTKNAPCAKCSGTGSSGTPCPKACDKGKLVCPGPCLKKGVGPWKVHPGLGLSRVIHYRVGQTGIGTMAVSEKHLGEVWEFKEVAPFALPTCPTCRGTAKSPCKDCREAGTFAQEMPKSLGPCKDCGGPARGAGRIPCAGCDATGSIPCAACLGTRFLPMPETFVRCTTCVKGVIPCSPCLETGIFDPRIPARVPVPGIVMSLRPDLRKALEKLEDGRLAPADRVFLRDGRALECSVLHTMSNGIVLVMRAPSGQDLQALALLSKHGFRRERLSAPPSPAAAPAAAAQPAPDAPKPAPGPDTVVLKDGTTVNGKVVGKSELMVIVQTPEGKVVKIEADKVAEIRSQPKAPK